MKYFFILGANSDLCRAELFAVLKKYEYHYRVVTTAEALCIIDSDDDINPTQLQHDLGGTIKIGEIIGSYTTPQALRDLSVKHLPVSGKVYFGFSIFTATGNQWNKIKKIIPSIAIAIKQELQINKQSSRWVTSKETELSSVIVKKNKMLSSGCEFYFLPIDSKLEIGKTKTVQDFEDYSLKDYGRPQRDDKSGMIPPKLAKIMLNLANISKSDVLLEPFCGSGTIIQEALLLGVKKIAGTDISAKAIEDTEKNILWLAEKYNIDTKKVALVQSSIQNIKKLFHVERRKQEMFHGTSLASDVPRGTFNAIVTEPYLGPALKGNEKIEKLQGIIKELEILYTETFSVFSHILAKNSRIVIIVPQFKHKGTILSLNFNESGLKLIEKYTYTREKQHIIREIRVYQHS